ncbi:MAG: TolC family protein [Melioribacteraceae bacterium]
MKKLIFLLATLITTVAFSQNQLSLSEAIELGLKNNYDIKIIKLSQQIADENNSWGTVGRFPSIDIGVGYRNRFDHTEANDIKSQTLAPYAQLNWVLFNGFAIFQNKYRLEDFYKLSEGNTALVIENTIQAIILSYYNVLLEDEKLKVFEQVNKLSKDRYDRELLSKEIGGSVTFQVLQAKNSWLEDKANFLSQKLSVENSVRRLNLLMGEKKDVKYVFSENFDVEFIEYEFEDLKQKMLANNKTLKNQYINAIIKDREIAIARSSMFPKLILNSGYDQSTRKQTIDDFPSSTSDAYDYYANLSISLNIFNGFNTKRAIEIAKIQHEISKIQVEEMEHKLSNTLIQQLELYNIRKEILSVTEENVEAAKLNFEIAEEKYKSGAINSFNYRDIQIVYLNASTRRLNAVYSLKETNTELARLTGSIITEKQ